MNQACGVSSDGNIEITRPDERSFLHVAAVDNEGNCSKTKTLMVQGRDKTPPEILEVKQDLSIKARDSVASNDEYVSEISGYAITTDVSVPDSFFDTIKLTGGSGCYYIWAADKAGNISDPYEIVVHSKFKFGDMEIRSLLFNGKTIRKVIFNGKEIFF